MAIQRDKTVAEIFRADQILDHMLAEAMSLMEQAADIFAHPASAAVNARDAAIDARICTTLARTVAWIIGRSSQGSERPNPPESSASLAIGSCTHPERRQLALRAERLAERARRLEMLFLTNPDEGLAASQGARTQKRSRMNETSLPYLRLVHSSD